MKTIFINENHKAGAAYTDYCILYYKYKGTTERALKLLTFCKRINSGKAVVVGDTMFMHVHAWSIIIHNKIKTQS